ncbi:hypothetical protein [Nocardioides sp. AE5]|uniref:hypothetical protein n=1 Tax=Nocardioides sp. AE5 TaxID=2962573 RepID=UPI00288220F4|nr:hypothetical protein [Nocardioides sp. AE5]MDT0203961.1 hypothetical protein [Nocardioides sp. AE5]
MDRARGLVAALFLAAAMLPALVVGPAYGDDGDRDDGARLAQARADLAESGLYLEPAVASGHLELWRDRLATAMAEADFGAPVRVALWTEIEGVLPSNYSDDVPTEPFEMLQVPDGVLVASVYDQVSVSTADPELYADVDALRVATDAIAEELVAAAGDPDRWRRTTSVAWAWIFLCLAAEQPPTAAELLDELSGDTSLLVDQVGAPRPEWRSTNEDFSPRSLAVIAGVLCCAVALMAWRWRHAARRAVLGSAAEQPELDPMVANLTSLSVQEELTGLVEAIARSKREPGDAAYDRAQACADAAAAYVDSERDRDRIAVHLLVADGERSLGGWTPNRRCFFHPSHKATTALKRKQVTVPCCAACARAVMAGERPVSLLVADSDGRVEPYYETDDVWTATGLGSLDERWARRSLLAALEAR